MIADPATAAPPTVYLLDTHGLVFQMFHGLPPMNAADGRPTNAVFGVARAIMDLYDRGAEYLIATFDCHVPTFRETMYAEYKAHRAPVPEDLIAQEPLILQVLEAMRVPILKNPGYEADDIIATVATAAVARGFNVVLGTADKDCRQLLSDKITIRNLRKNETLDAEFLMKDWGIRPEQVVDFQALVGDAADNVPGVAGCGPKTASKWLKEYGTLENLIANSDRLGGPKLKESFQKAAADGSLMLSRTLVKLRTDVPMEFDWDGWKRRDWDGPKLLELFQEFGFRTFANRVRSTLTDIGAKKNEAILEAVAPKPPSHLTPSPSPAEEEGIKKPRPGQQSLFDAIDDDAPMVPPPPVLDNWESHYELVDTPAKFQEFLLKLKAQPRFAFDLETTSLEPLNAEIVGYAFSWKATEAFYLPVRAPKDCPQLDPVATLAALKPIFEDPKHGKVNQNIKYDRLVLRNSGVELEGTVGDSMVAHYLLYPGARSHNLDDMTLNYFQHKNISISELIGKGKKQIRMDQVPTDRVLAYAAEDADAAWRLVELLEPQLPNEVRPLYDDLEIPLVEVLAELEFNGIRLDVELLKKLSGQMAEQLAATEKAIHELAGREFNIASLKQLQVVLFDDLKLPVLKKTGIKGEPSTDHEVLEKLAAMGHELPKQLLAHRKVGKLKSTYVDALPTMVNARTGRVHGSFNQSVATTGRLSSSDPNLQNIPMRTEQGREIRQAFIPPDGWSLLSADYSQIELRLLAHFCADDNLRKAFADDRDIHASVAAEIFQLPESQVTKEQRSVAKTVNFGVIYGISATGLSIQLGIDRKKAAKFIDDYFARYPRVQQYQDTLLAQARERGFVKTILGRRRNFDPTAIRPRSTYEQRNQAEREAINMEIQGSAADLMKVAMLNIHRKLKSGKYQSKMLLSVHDELVFEVPLGERAAMVKLVRDEMANALTVSVPLKVDVAIGPNWLDVEDAG